MKSLGLLHLRQESNFFCSSFVYILIILVILTPYSNIFLMDVCFSKTARFVIKSIDWLEPWAELSEWEKFFLQYCENITLFIIKIVLLFSV